MRVGSSLTIGYMPAPARYLEKLTSHLPGHQVPCFHQQLRLALSNQFAEGQLDIGLVEGAVNDDMLFFISFMEDNLIAVCGQGHPFAQRESVSLDEFLSQPLLAREPGSGTRELFQSAVTLWETIESRVGEREHHRADTSRRSGQWRICSARKAG